MSIDLAAIEPYLRVPTPAYVDFGGELTPLLGGPVQRINRLGNRYRLGYETAPVPEEPTGRVIAAWLRLAKTQGARITWPQPGLVIGTPGTPLIAEAAEAGSTIKLKGLTAGYAIRFGQFFSIVHAGLRYLHSAAAQSTADGSGNATVVLNEPLRTDIDVDDVVEIASPKIEGLLQSGDLEWPGMLEPYVQFSFTIAESR